MKTQVPIYRAKKIDSNTWITGTLIKCTKDIWKPTMNNVYHIVLNASHNYKIGLHLESYEIDPSTLSIHFPDMLDSEGNKIFASLSEDGKGGDIIDRVTYQAKSEVIKCDKDGFISTYIWDWLALKNEKIKVIGIKQ